MDDFKRSVTKRSSSHNRGTDQHQPTAMQATTTITRNIRASVRYQNLKSADHEAEI